MQGLMTIISSTWVCIFTVVSLIVLAGCMWLLRVALDWWLDIDYVKKLKEWVNEQSNIDRKHH